MTKNNTKDEKYWKEKLTPEQYKILREKGTESPGSSDLLHNKKEGAYHCMACGAVLFSSGAKFDSKSGWPSFTDPENTKNIILEKDNSLFMHRTEVKCANCGSHLGHVFDDGPGESGERYCINGACLAFKPKGK